MMSAEDPRPLLNDTELRKALGISERTFYRLKKRGAFRMFEVARPMGQRRYAATLVDRFTAGESATILGGRRRSG